MRRTIIAGILLSFGCAISQVHAANLYVYSYVGSTFQDSYADSLPWPNWNDPAVSPRISVQLTFSAPLAPNLPLAPVPELLSYVISDNARVITTDSIYSTKQISVGTDSSGNLTVWDIYFERESVGQGENLSMGSRQGVPGRMNRDNSGYCPTLIAPCVTADHENNYRSGDGHYVSAWACYPSCGTSGESNPYLTRPSWTLSAELAPVPVPPAVWLFGSALGLMGWMRRKAIA